MSKRSESRAARSGVGAARLGAWLLASSVAACAMPKAPVDAPLATGLPSSSAEPPPRRPDGVVLEPPAALPGPTRRADANGVVALREPLSSDLVAEVVEAMADAWERGQLEEMVALLATDAGPLDGRTRGRTALVESWRQRLRAHDYARLVNVEIVRRDRIAHWEWDELGGPDSPARPRDMRPGEILVRAPIEVTHFGGERLFGDAMVLIVRPEDRKLKVVAYGEVDLSP